VSLSTRAAVYAIPAHRSFADALAAGLIARHGRQKTDLARGVILVPNNRAARAIADAFVRLSDGGLLLPRLVPIGDEELDLRIGGILDPLDMGEAVPPAVAPIERLLLLTQLVQRHVSSAVETAEAMRLAQDLARTLDQLLIEEVPPARLREIAADLPELSSHWQMSLERLEVILTEWPKLLAERGRIDLADRRNRLLDRAADRWRARPPAGFVVAAGIDTTAPAVARLLRVVSRLPEGMLVFSALDLAMPAQEWDSLGPHDPDPASPQRRRSVETHPQFHLKLLLDRIGVARGEVRLWRQGGGRDAAAARSRAIGNAMAPPFATGKWRSLRPADRRMPGVRGLELVDPAEEAQAIAIAMREALDQPGRTAALVTPDRGLARRVSAHLRRWGIEADDSAGRPLPETPPGTLILALAAAAAEAFAPVPLLALLKHPLVARGERRLEWLEGARVLDLALRGPRPPAGLTGIGGHLDDGNGRSADLRVRAAAWWGDVAELLRPLERTLAAPDLNLASALQSLREAAESLCGREIWAGPAGRCASDFFTDLEHASASGPAVVKAAELLPLLDQLMRPIAVRPPYGQHPRLFIWGLLEARLQHADLMIAAGLNEGIWPALPTPDPWLAPRIRHELGLPGLERRIGLAAHDFATAVGAREILVTRARRDARSPTVASRFWLRLEAMTGGLTRSPMHKYWARSIDRPAAYLPADRPEPCPRSALRPRSISVTEVDRLKADPYAFYARKMLGLQSLDAVDADPSAAWRGNAVHEILEAWMKEDDCDPDRLTARAEELLRRASTHPLMRALWQPRLMEAIDWIARQVEEHRVEGRRPLKAEVGGRCRIEDVDLHGRADRIDRLADGALAIVDYKTGKAPTSKAVREGYSMQLGLLAVIAEAGGFEGIEGRVAAFEYWSLARGRDGLGHVASPVGGRAGIAAEEFAALALRQFIGASRAWLTGEEPFTAKLHPEYAPYAEYDQLMRLDEWYGRAEL
jgi:ATP-dependent helicase/nuclease subunit B